MSAKFEPTLTSAEAYAKEGRIEEWVHEYLLGEGHNKPFSDGLRLQERFFTSPLMLPISALCRCCGPEENMEYRVRPEAFERKVSGIMQAAEGDADLPPLIVNFADGELTLNDGNHRYEAYLRLGQRECSVIIWTSSREDMVRFAEKYRI